MSFDEIVLTKEGQNLLSKAQNGKVLNFKRVALGDGELEENEDINNFKGLKDEKLSLNINKLENLQDNITRITVTLSNQNIEEGFLCREIGVIAEDPDTKDEVLYCYGNSKQNGEYIADKNSKNVLEKVIRLNLIISNVSNISATINESQVFASQEDLKQLENILNAHQAKLDTIEEGANNYVHPTTAGNKHIPSGGSSGQVLRWDSSGTAVWGEDNNTTYEVATTSSNGLMSSTDKTNLDYLMTELESLLSEV